MNIEQQMQQQLDNLTKPPGSLGVLEALALQMASLQQSLQPTITQPHIAVFAADHGIAATGLVNPYPQAVTAQMVHNFCQGGAAINVLCRLHQVQLTVVDAGVATTLPRHLPVQHRKIAMGTANYLQGPAMTEAQATACLLAGAPGGNELAQTGCNTLGLGEMGIGNSSSAALIMHNLLQLPLHQCVGRGTGTNAQQYHTKLHTLQQVARLHQLDSGPLPAHTLLQAVGGFEIAMLAGACLQAAQQGMLIVADGFITTAAWLCAWQIQPWLVKHTVFAHCSAEQGHTAMLQAIPARPLLQLDMRLGEGTGAALAMPILRSACALATQMASFNQAGVSRSSL